MIISKPCVKCKETKPLDQFNKNRAKKDGLQTRCRPCGQQHARDRYYRYKEHHQKKVKEYHKRIRKVKQGIIVEHLLKNPCVDCGEDDPIVLEYDHVRGDKRYTISTLVCNSYTVNTLVKEMDKCDVRCANCHRRKTAKDRSYWIVEHLKSKK